EPELPPPFTGWPYRRHLWFRARNRLGYAVSDWVTRPLTQVLSKYRKKWGLPPLQSLEASFSSTEQISQQPPVFDFPRRKLLKNFHYVGPLRNALPSPIPFPW